MEYLGTWGTLIKKLEVENLVSDSLELHYYLSADVFVFGDRFMD
jgi:hypothetical protein